MGVARLFVRRRDGRVEVRLNDGGRSFVHDAFAQVVTAERDPEHEWHTSLTPPIDPAVDQDDPVATLRRQSDMITNAELALVTSGEQFLNAAEAWAWLSTLQVALRSVAVSRGLLSDERLARSDAATLEYVRTLQQLLFALAECL
jgi:hypothetical protein